MLAMMMGEFVDKLLERENCSVEGKKCCSIQKVVNGINKLA
jgi:hypothetical protein